MSFRVILGQGRAEVACCTLAVDYTFQYTDGTQGTGSHTGVVVEHEITASPTTECNALLGSDKTCYYRFRTPYNVTELSHRYQDLEAKTREHNPIIYLLFQTLKRNGLVARVP